MKRLLLLMLLCSSCFSYEYLEPIYKLPPEITYSCTDATLETSFLKMFKIWNFACDNIFTLTKVESKAVGDSVIDIQYTTLLPKNILGRHLRNKGINIIQINQDIADPRINATMLHEIGHCLYLAHNQITPFSIMNLEIKVEATIVQDDVDGVRELYGLSPLVFDFKMRLRRRTVVIAAPYGKVDWWFSDLINIFSKQTVIHRFRYPFDGGDYVEMVYNGISVYKFIPKPTR